MNTGVVIRNADIEDVTVLCGLVRDSYRSVAQRLNLTLENCPKHPSNCTEEWIRNDLDRGVSFYLLEHNGRPAGCAALEIPQPELGYLERLAVLPLSRHKGLGRSLVDHVFLQAKNAGVHNISIGIIAAQTDLKNWYQKIGFAEGNTREFKHLPFSVTFMMYQLPSKGDIDEN